MGLLGIDGSKWKYVLFFDPEADEIKTISGVHIISVDELRTKLVSLVDAGEKIKKVTAYKEKMIRWPLTDVFFLYHMFIIFKTARWFWSIEKTTVGITIQRSKSLQAVRDRFRRGKRKSGFQCLEEDRGNASVGDLINWLWQQDELNNNYVITSSNCHHFAKKVYDFVSRYKRFDVSQCSTVIKCQEHSFWVAACLIELSPIFSFSKSLW